jgi:hypothetical protein
MFALSRRLQLQCPPYRVHTCAQEFQLVEKKELAPMQELIDKLTTQPSSRAVAAADADLAADAAAGGAPAEAAAAGTEPANP